MTAFAQLDAPSPSFLQKTSELSIRRQCELLHIQRSEVYYKPVELSVEEKDVKGGWFYLEMNVRDDQKLVEIWLTNAEKN